MKPALQDIRTEEMVLNMGPQHPATHGILRVILKTDGEVVLDAAPHVGNLHRCAEKISESLPYYQAMPYVDRMDYLAAMNNEMGLAVAVERLANLEVPPRGQYIRVIVAEMNRIASHLMAVGTYGIDMGAFTPFLYCFRERERALDLLEQVSGGRLLYHYIWVGGVAKDVDPKWLDDVKRFCDVMEENLPEYNALLTFNHIFINRTVKIGVCPPELAIAAGLTGPAIRGSGIDRDVRREQPYCGYDTLEFSVPVAPFEEGVVGDCWSRHRVRMLEMEQSVRLIRQAVEKVEGLAGQPTNVKLPKVFKPPAGEVYSVTENPRGELAYYLVSTGEPIPWRHRVRGPSFCNISILPDLVRGHMISDVVAVIGSLDIVLGEVDR